MFLPHWPVRRKSSGKMIQILDLLGNPHRKLPEVIHVTGTNGKGSTISFLREIFQKHGFKTHCFTSPHLIRFNENFIIANNEISDSLIYELTEEIRITLEGKIEIGFLEYQAVLALLAFSRFEADICLIESIMGAKNDPTNILNKKLLAIITSISLDHQDLLGQTIAEISLDKAHIINNCNMLISAPQNHITKKIITNFCKMNNVQIFNHEINYDFDIIVDPKTNIEKLAYINIQEQEISYYDLPKKLIGDHQIINLITALSAIKNQSKFCFQDELINEAIKDSDEIGRLEKITSKKFPDNLEIWFDGAHNQGGAHILNNWLNKMSSDKKNIIIYGRSENKNHHDFLSFFLKGNSELNFVEVKNEPSPETKSQFQKFLNQNPKYDCKIYDNLEHIFDEYLVNIKSPSRIIICGSFYLYRDLQEILA